MAVLSLHVFTPVAERRLVPGSPAHRVVPAGHRIHVQVRGLHTHQRRRTHQSIRAFQSSDLNILFQYSF